MASAFVKTFARSLTTGVSALFLAGSIAQAQVQEPAPPPQQEPVEVSESDIRTFAEIYVEVEQTRNELTVDMNDATTPEEAQEIQAKMQEEIISTISDKGWSVEQYNQVATAISNDPELRTTALELINELSSG